MYFKDTSKPNNHPVTHTHHQFRKLEILFWWQYMCDHKCNCVHNFLYIVNTRISLICNSPSYETSSILICFYKGLQKVDIKTVKTVVFLCLLLLLSINLIYSKSWLIMLCCAVYQQKKRSLYSFLHVQSSKSCLLYTANVTSDSKSQYPLKIEFILMSN